MALKTISSFELTPNWRHGGSTAKLRLYYGDNFVDSEQRPVIGGAIGSSSFYDEADITITNNVATVANFTLVTTEDSNKPNVKVSGVLYDQGGSMKGTIFEWSVPDNTKIASPATFAALDAYNRRNSVINPPKFYLTQAQIIQLINSMLGQVGLGPATNLVLGLTRLRIAAANPLEPEVYGTNDPQVRDALKWAGVDLDALMATPAHGNTPVFDAVSLTWKPSAGGLLDGDRGDITLAVGATVWTINNNVVSYAKMQDVSAASRLLGRGDSGAGDPEEIALGAGLSLSGTTLSSSPVGAAGGDLSGTYPNPTVKANLKTTTLPFIIDGGGSTITTGIKGDLPIDFACTISVATMLADQSGSIVVDIWKDTYANFPPTDADSITASAPPTISSATKSQDSTLTGWTVSLSAGDVLRFNVDSVTSIQRVTIWLKVTLT